MNSEPSIINHFTGDYAFLSNFYLHPIDVLGCGICSSVEHAFQALKTTDPLERARILEHKSPAMAKKAGRFVAIRPGWDEKRYDIMHALLKKKFFRGTPLADQLIATEGFTLIEGNMWHDNTWGNCECDQEACKEPGLNWLGFLLMAIRDELLIGDDEMMLVVRDIDEPRPISKKKSRKKK